MENWKLTITDPPEQGKEILGFAEEWIDEDFNPDGIRICYMQDFLNDSGSHIWSSAAWCNNCDEWHTVDTDDLDLNGNLFNPARNVPPTHWMPKPQSPKHQEL